MSISGKEEDKKRPMQLIKKQVEVVDHVLTGAMVRQKRLANDMMIHTLAEKTGLSITHVSSLERGKRSWNANLLRRFEAVFTENQDNED